MINDILFTTIMNVAKQRGTKVIFIGDDGQLKPVSQNTIAKPFTRKENII